MVIDKFYQTFSEYCRIYQIQWIITELIFLTNINFIKFFFSNNSMNSVNSVNKIYFFSYKIISKKY